MAETAAPGSAGRPEGQRRRRWLMGISLLLLALYLLPLALSALTLRRDGGTWYTARRDPSGLAPSPEITSDAVLQVYAARAYGWRGVFGVHSWIAVKPSNAAVYTRYEVTGWSVARGGGALKVDRMGPDNYWFGARPEVLLDRRGEGVDTLIEQVRLAITRYPHLDSYQVWPGPNSNSFVAHVARAVPELGLDLPPTAIGKDYFPGLLASAPSGTGWQLSLGGAAGLLVALEEGVEVNLLGLSAGLDFNDPALRLPGLGRIGADRSLQPSEASGRSAAARPSSLSSSRSSSSRSAGVSADSSSD